MGGKGRWDAVRLLTDELRSQLQWCVQMLQRYNGSRMIKREASLVIVGDASDVGAGGEQQRLLPHRYAILHEATEAPHMHTQHTAWQAAMPASTSLQNLHAAMACSKGMQTSTLPCMQPSIQNLHGAVHIAMHVA